MKHLQLDADGRLHHLITLDGLELSILNQILDRAESFKDASLGFNSDAGLLKGKTIVNLFFEASTRTRTTFELAAKRLSANVLNINVDASSASKGESLIDTLKTLEAMHCDMFVIRHPDSGAAAFFAKHAKPGVSILNAGDGRYSHPTQGLLDVFSIRQYKPDFGALRVVIVGDILHSRVARSQIAALSTLGTGEIRVVAPKPLLPTAIDQLGVHVFHNMGEGIENADVIIMLRLQRERMKGVHLPSEGEYYRTFGLSQKRLSKAKKDCLVMHPGPMNRGVEIASLVADGKQSIITEQVSNGIAIRMAVMAMTLHREPQL